jgi:hypothetical protein
VISYFILRLGAETTQVNDLFCFCSQSGNPADCNSFDIIHYRHIRSAIAATLTSKPDVLFVSYLNLSSVRYKLHFGPLWLQIIQCILISGWKRKIKKTEMHRFVVKNISHNFGIYYFPWRKPITSKSLWQLLYLQYSNSKLEHKTAL